MESKGAISELLCLLFLSFSAATLSRRSDRTICVITASTRRPQIAQPDTRDGMSREPRSSSRDAGAHMWQEDGTQETEGEGAD